MLYPTELRALVIVCRTNAAQQQADFSPTADFNWTLRACDAERGKNSARIDTLTIANTLMAGSKGLSANTMK